jgi:GNAT superfamily N-acetyltransferase
MTEHRIRVGRATDAERFLATDHIVWFSEVPAAPAEQQLIGLHHDQRFAADVDGSDPAAYPGVYGVFPMTLSVPGNGPGIGPGIGPGNEAGQRTGSRQVPCAGLTWVGVHPDHRRKGVLTAMLAHHLEQVRAEEGTHVSALHASEPAIYGRYGYGLASLELEVTLGRGATLSAPHLDDAVAAVTTQFAIMAATGMPERLRACHLRCAENGSVVGDAGYYSRLCFPLPEHQREKEPMRVLFARRDGEDVGFAIFRRKHKWERERPAGELSVWFMAGDPAARLALLRRLVDFDLMGTVTLSAVGVDDLVLTWAGGPRATADVGTFDSLWIRLVHLAEALQARAWSAPCDVVVDVADRAAPWNEGRWRIRAAASGEATVERSTGEADLALPVEALGSAYLGSGNLVALHRAGLLTEHRRGAASELWRAMRTDVAPTGAIMF